MLTFAMPIMGLDILFSLFPLLVIRLAINNSKFKTYIEIKFELKLTKILFEANKSHKISWFKNNIQ